MSNYPISEPITKTITTTYTTYTINNLIITPFEQASMIIQLFTEDKQTSITQYLVMSGNDYNNWGGDDEYLINWVNNYLINWFN